MNFTFFKHFRLTFHKWSLISCFFLQCMFMVLAYRPEAVALSSAATSIVSAGGVGSGVGAIAMGKTRSPLATVEEEHAAPVNSRVAGAAPPEAGHGTAAKYKEESHVAPGAAAATSLSSGADTYGVGLSGKGEVGYQVVDSKNCGRASLFSSRDCDTNVHPGIFSKIGRGVGDVFRGAGSLIGSGMGLMGGMGGGMGLMGGMGGMGTMGGGMGGMGSMGTMGGGMGGMGSMGTMGGGMGGMGGMGGIGGVSGGNGFNNSPGSYGPLGGQSSGTYGGAENAGAGGLAGSNGPNSNGLGGGGVSNGYSGPNMGQGGFPGGYGGGQQGMGQGGYPGGQQGMGQGGNSGGGQQGMGPNGSDGAANGLAPAQQALAEAGFSPQTVSVPAQQIGMTNAPNLEATPKAGGMDSKKPALKTVDNVFGDATDSDTKPYMKKGWFGDNPEGAQGRLVSINDGFQEVAGTVRDNMPTSTPKTLTN